VIFEQAELFGREAIEAQFDEVSESRSTLYM
jgi:hypothetical protein